MSIADPATADVDETDVRMLTDFTPDTFDMGWYVLNDNVMGGRSKGGFESGHGELVFSGSTNTNGGGFSSIRTKRMELDLSSHDGIRLRVFGDGRRYTWRLTSNATWRGRLVSYWADFDTRDGAWATVDIPFSNFVPKFRGNELRGPGIGTDEITGMGLMIYDGKDGPFEMKLASVQTWSTVGSRDVDTLAAR